MFTVEVEIFVMENLEKIWDGEDSRVCTIVVTYRVSETMHTR